MHAMAAMQNLFVQLSDQNSVSILNEFFVDVINTCISKVLEPQFIDLGYSTMTQDSVNDITQFCDSFGLRDSLIGFCDNLLQTINDQILSSTSKYSEGQIELLLNNFGGLLQILIVRIEQQNMPEHLVNNLITVLNMLCERDYCRQGVLLMLNGMLNAFELGWVKNFAPTVIGVIESTIKDQSASQVYQFDLPSKRIATGLIQDLCNVMGPEITQHLRQLTSILFTIL